MEYPFDSTGIDSMIDPLLNPNPDPWEETETAHLRAFLKLTPTERFHLLMDAIEFMHMLRPPAPRTDETRASQNG